MNPLRSVTKTILLGFAVAVILALIGSKLVFNPIGITITLHALSAFVWMGMLYYLNFVQVPAINAATEDAGGPGPLAISKYAAPRALLWFRWAALLTWLFGMYAFYLIGFGLVDLFTFPAGKMVFVSGAWIGTIMFLNVWLVIWPNQKKILGIVTATPEEIAKARTIALMASRTNVILSIPVIMFMIAQSHGLPFR